MTPEPVERGAVVLLCPPDTWIFEAAREGGIVPPGPCPGGYAPLLKPVAAVAGDVVEVGSAGVRVNGQLLLNSRPLHILPAGRLVPPYPAGKHVVASGEVWLVSEFHPGSFDSRYYGPLPLSAVAGLAEPIWVLDE